MINYLFARFPPLPTTTWGVWEWVLSIAVAHIVLNNIVKLIWMRQSPFSDAASAAIGSRISTALAFGTSVMLLIGLKNPRLMALIGDTKSFLAIAALAGVYYGVVAIGRRD